MDSTMNEEEILRSLDDENEENYDSNTCNTNRSEIDKNFLISVSDEGISSFIRKMEKIYSVETDEGKLMRLLLAATKNSGGTIKILHAFINCLSAFFKEITSACETELLKREIKLEKHLLRCDVEVYIM